MPTIVWMTGWEHGVNPTTNGGGLANALSGSPTVVTSPVRTGTYALRCNPAGAAQYVQKTVTGDRLVLRICVRFDALPSADCDLFTIRDAGGLSFRFRYIQASNKFQVVFGSTDPQLSSMTVSTGQWYRVELNVLLNAATRTCAWQVDGTAQTQSASTQTASTVASLRLGTGSTETFTCYYDDLLASVTNADYPPGDGGATGLSPNAEGTHNPGTNEIEDNAGGDINGTTVQAYPLMDDVPMTSTADYVQQAAAHSIPDAHYAEVGFADISTSLSVLGVVGLLAYKSSSTSANRGSTLALRSDATQIEIYGTPAVPVDYSESSLFYKSAIITAPGGGWTPTEVNALKMRVGGSSDASPLPQWHALMFEVDAVLGGVTVAPSPASAVGRVVAPTVVLGSLALAPAARSAIGRVVAPTVVLGSLALAPNAAQAIGRVVAPAVVITTPPITPAPATAVGRVLAPGVVLGSVIVANAVAAAFGRVVAPTVVMGSLALSPGPASAIGRVVAPAVEISGGGAASPVRRRIRWPYFHWRRFSRWP